MEGLKILILFASISAVFSGGPSLCGPSDNELLSFPQAWLNLQDHFQKLNIDVTSAHPIFTSALVLVLKCQANSAIEFAGHAINQLSGVDYNEITSFLNGTLAPVSGTPLDCITNEIIYMQQHILTLFDEVVPFLENSIQTETTPNDCDEANARIEAYFEISRAYSMRVGELLGEIGEAFSSIGLVDLYIHHLLSLAPCFDKVFGTTMGSLLNSDGNAITQYFYEEETVLPYPFSCIQANLEYLRDNFFDLFPYLYFGDLTAIDLRILS